MSPWREHGPAHTSISDFWPPDCETRNFYCFQHLPNPQGAVICCKQSGDQRERERERLLLPEQAGEVILEQRPGQGKGPGVHWGDNIPCGEKAPGRGERGRVLSWCHHSERSHMFAPKPWAHTHTTPLQALLGSHPHCHFFHNRCLPNDGRHWLSNSYGCCERFWASR